MLYLDLETRSDVDLIFHGLRRYAEDASTEVICMAYAFDDGPIEFWWGNNLSMEPGATPPNNTYEIFPSRVKEHFKNGGLVTAHNASFEKHIFDYVIARTHGIVTPEPTQWR
jgi:DNA polymerase